MHVSRFNYVADYEKDHQKLLVNFLTRSADIIDPESVGCFLNSIEKNKFTSEERDYLIERGYFFSNKDQESQILRQLYENEFEDSGPIYVLNLGMFTIEQSRLDEILKSINEMERRKNGKTKSELILYVERLFDQSLITQDLEEFVKNCNSLNLSTKLVTTQKNLTSFHSLFTKGLVADLCLICPLSEFENSMLFPDDVERILDHFIEYDINLTVDVKVARKDVKNLKPLMNYFIRKGWPFRENFECYLEPADNEACIFGYRYSSDIELSREIFEAFRTYPQTEFFNMEKWIGINIVYALIWKGRLPSPSFHFCSASKRLVVFTADGNIFPCLKLAETTNKTLIRDRAKFEKFQQRNGMISSDCQQCKYILSCGGGCSYKTFMQNNGRVCCPPIKDLIEVSLEAYFYELLEKSKFIEQYQEGAQA